AFAADDEARKSPAIQKQHGLLAVVEPLVNGFDQLSRKSRVLARRMELLAHIDQFDFRHWAALDAFPQFQARVLAAIRVVAAFEARRGAAQKPDGPGIARADDRDVAAVITRRFLLLVALVVFFVDDDQAEIPHWRENSRSSCDDDPGFTGTNAPPLLRALGIMK